MKNIALTAAAFLIAAHLWAGPARAAEPRTIEFDLDGDGRRELIVLDAGHDPALSIWRGRRLLWRGVHAAWKPWALKVADVDGDGRVEIAVGVYKSTRFFPKAHNCLFIYGWDGQRAFPKWLGSTLGRPFTDFAFADFDRNGRNELVALETRRDGLRSLAVYSWNGFGFTLDWERGAWRTASLASGEGGRVVLEADGERINITGE